SSPVAYLDPLLFASPQPEGYELTREVARRRAECQGGLVRLLESANPVVVAHALTALRWMGSPALALLPEALLVDRRTVTIPGCRFVTKTVGEIARECANEA